MDNYNKLIATLPNLSEDRLRDIYNRCRILLDLKPEGKAKPQHEPEDWLLAGYRYELLRLGIANGAPDTKISSISRTYALDGGVMRQHLLEQCGSTLTPSQRTALGRIAARALIGFLAYVNVPLGLKPLLEHTKRLSEAIEYCFPGYQAAGLLHWLAMEHRDPTRRTASHLTSTVDPNHTTR